VGGCNDERRYVLPHRDLCAEVWNKNTGRQSVIHQSGYISTYVLYQAYSCGKSRMLCGQC
jgi:hypothetical protein